MVISFFVIVPVLSDAITVAAPNASTEDSFFTMAFFFASLATPNASETEICAGNPSGTIAAATPIVKISASFKASPIKSFTASNTEPSIKVI